MKVIVIKRLARSYFMLFVRCLSILNDNKVDWIKKMERVSYCSLTFNSVLVVVYFDEIQFGLYKCEEITVTVSSRILSFEM